jgi:chromate transport protein ChrA
MVVVVRFLRKRGNSEEQVEGEVEGAKRAIVVVVLHTLLSFWEWADLQPLYGLYFEMSLGMINLKCTSCEL